MVFLFLQSSSCISSGVLGHTCKSVFFYHFGRHALSLGVSGLLAREVEISLHESQLGFLARYTKQTAAVNR